MADAIPESVAELFLHKPRLAVYQLQGPFGTSRDAIAAAIAKCFVDLDNLTCCHVVLPFGFINLTLS
jgi:hypothetical protein